MTPLVDYANDQDEHADGGGDDGRAGDLARQGSGQWLVAAGGGMCGEAESGQREQGTY